MSKLASHRQILPVVVIIKRWNPRTKVLKVRRKHFTIFWGYKNGYKQYKISWREARASKVSAAARFFSRVCLPSCGWLGGAKLRRRTVFARCFLGNWVNRISTWRVQTSGILIISRVEHLTSLRSNSTDLKPREMYFIFATKPLKKYNKKNRNIKTACFRCPVLTLGFST